MKWTGYGGILLSLLLLYTLYSLGLPILLAVSLGVFFIVIIYLKEPVYKKIDGFLIGRFPATASWPSWGRTLLVLVLFVLLYALMKLVLFELLKLVGVDVQRIMLEGINNSISK